MLQNPRQPSHAIPVTVPIICKLTNRLNRIASPKAGLILVFAPFARICRIRKGFGGTSMGAVVGGMQTGLSLQTVMHEIQKRRCTREKWREASEGVHRGREVKVKCTVKIKVIHRYGLLLGRTRGYRYVRRDRDSTQKPHKTQERKNTRGPIKLKRDRKRGIKYENEDRKRERKSRMSGDPRDRKEEGRRQDSPRQNRNASVYQGHPHSITKTSGSSEGVMRTSLVKPIKQSTLLTILASSSVPENSFDNFLTRLSKV